MRRTVTFSRAKRSSSKKHYKRSPSAHSPQDDDYVVQVLNNRSVSDRDILITRQQYEDLKQGRKQLKEAQKSLKDFTIKWENDKGFWENERQRLQSKIDALEDRLRLDSGHLQELTFANAKLEGDLRVAHTQLSEWSRTNDKRAPDAARAIEKCIRILESDVLNLLDFSQSFSQKSQLLKLVREAVFHASETRSFLSSSDEIPRGIDCKRLSSSSIREYQTAVEKMKEQTRLIRERLRLLEGDGAVRKTIEDYECRLSLLESEKAMLTDHIQTLQSTLSEQCHVIEHLKGIISSLAGPVSPSKQRLMATPPQRSPTSVGESLSISPGLTTQSRLSSPFTLKSASRPRDLTTEIEALDRDIEVLQYSLQKVLE